MNGWWYELIWWWCEWIWSIYMLLNGWVCGYDDSMNGYDDGTIAWMIELNELYEWIERIELIEYS